VAKTAKAPEQRASAADADEKLQRAIGLLCEDAARVELWTCAPNGFAQPVPDYDAPLRYGRESKPDQS
jgi:hypothetical protein